MKDLTKSKDSNNMYSYQDDKKSNIIQSNALRRSLGGNNPIYLMMAIIYQKINH